MAKKPSKKREALLKKVDATKEYSVDEAMATLKNLSQQILTKLLKLL